MSEGDVGTLREWLCDDSLENTKNFRISESLQCICIEIFDDFLLANMKDR